MKHCSSVLLSNIHTDRKQALFPVGHQAEKRHAGSSLKIVIPPHRLKIENRYGHP